MKALIAALLLAQAAEAPGLRVQDEGTTKGYATTLNCVGTGITCSVAGPRATLNVSGGGYTLPAATATVLGGVKGTGSALICGGTDKATGFDVNGTLQCGADQTGSASPGGTSGNLQTNNGSGGFGAYAGATCGANQYVSATDASGALTCSQVTTAQLSGTVTDAQLASNYSGVGACPANQYASGLNDNAAPTCAQVGYAQVSGTPSIPADISGASYWTKVAEGSLSNEIALGSLSSGLILNTTTTGVPTIYGGASCTNQFPRSLNASGAPSCASVALADFTANLGTTTTVLHGNGAGQPAFSGVSLTADATANQGTTTTLLHGNGAGQPTFAGVSLANDTTANQGTTTTVLHGNGAGQPSFGSVVSGDISGQLTEAVGGTGAGALTCTNQFLTSNGTAYSCSTDTLAGAQHANQGTATTLLHGNGAGNPTWSGIALADHVANLGTTTTVLHGNAAGQPTYAGVSLTADATANQGATNQTLHGNAAGQPTWSQVAYSEITGTPSIPADISGAHYVTTQAEGGLSAEAVLPTCTGTDKLTFNGTTISCATDQLGGGSGNAVEVSIGLGTGGGLVYSTTVTGQAWVTATSKIVCSPFATSADGQTVETYYAAGLDVMTANRVNGVGFDLAVRNPHGATGTFRFHCLGV